MLKAVLFDMDGVLIDSEPAWEKVEMKLAKQFNIPVTKELQKRYTGVHHSVMWDDLKSIFGYEEKAETITNLESCFMTEYYKNGNLLPILPTMDLIKELRANNIDCALATSNDRKNAEYVTERLGLTKYISVIISNSDVNNCKPAPDIFLAAADNLGRKPRECLVVEDSRSGCIAAKAAGMKVVGYKNPNSGNQDLSSADKIILDLNELSIEVLKKLSSNG